MLILKKGKKNNIYNIGNNEQVTIKKLIKKIEKILRVDIKIIPGKLRKGSTKKRCPDIKKLSKLGHINKINLFVGLKDTIKWYLQNPNTK